MHRIFSFLKNWNDHATYIWDYFALSVLLLTACAPSEEGGAPNTETGGAPATPNIGTTRGVTILRKSMGDITFIDAGAGVQSIIQSDGGYQFTINGKFPDEVHVGDWVEVIFTSGMGEDGTRYLCTKHTDYCREIRAMNAIPKEDPPIHQ